MHNGGSTSGRFHPVGTPAFFLGIVKHQSQWRGEMRKGRSQEFSLHRSRCARLYRKAGSTRHVPELAPNQRHRESGSFHRRARFQLPGCVFKTSRIALSSNASVTDRSPIRKRLALFSRTPAAAANSSQKKARVRAVRISSGDFPALMEIMAKIETHRRNSFSPSSTMA